MSTVCDMYYSYVTCMKFINLILLYIILLHFSYASFSCKTLWSGNSITMCYFLFKNNVPSTSLTYTILSVTSITSHKYPTLQLPPIILTHCPISRLCCRTKIVSSSAVIFSFISNFSIFALDCLCICIHLDSVTLLFCYV